MRQTTSRRGLLDVRFDYLFTNLIIPRLMAAQVSNKVGSQEVLIISTPKLWRALRNQINMAR